jgi:hypothetical protein
MPFRHSSGDKNDPWTYRRVLVVIAVLALLVGLALRFWPGLRAWFL